MLCEICHENEARVVYTEIINGVKKEQHLCESCAAKQSPFNIMGKIGPDIQFGNILSGLLQSFAKGLNAMQEKETICGRCGMTASEFAKTGRLGCPNCYSAFAPILDKNLKTSQGAVENKGKRPMNAVYFEPAKYSQKDEEQVAGDVLGTAGTIEDILGDEIPAAKPDRKGKVSNGNTDGKISKDRNILKDRNIRRDSEKAIPGTKSFDREIALIRGSMEKAVKNENYELAALLRDRLHGLEEKAGRAVTGPDRTAKTAETGKTDKTAGTKKAGKTAEAKKKDKADEAKKKDKPVGTEKTDKLAETKKTGKSAATKKTGKTSGGKAKSSGKSSKTNKTEKPTE